MNNGVCLSLPLAIRCFGLSTVQSITLLIPSCIEVLCVSVLVWSQWGRGRKHWFLVSDTWLFALLNIVEFIPRVHEGLIPSLFAFEVYDRVLAAASAVPLLFFMLFLLSYTKADLLPILPMRYRSTLALLLLLCIPLVVIMTELAALLGFSYKTSSADATYRFLPDFTNDDTRMIWSLFNSIALAVFIIYQASTFFLTGFRIARHFLIDRDESLSRRSNKDVMTIKGTGWLAAGIKMGAIETLLAFIPNGWELVFARRLCRLLGRIFLLIGMMKGMDQLDGFTLFRAASLDSIEGLPPRRIPVMDSIRGRIGNPRLSTFGRLSPTARNFHEAHKVRLALPTSNLARIDSRSSEGGPEEKKSTISGPIIMSAKESSFAEFNSPRAVPAPPIARPRPARVQPRLDDQARVTLHYDGLRAPTLVMRFSALQMPSPGTVLATLKDTSPTDTKPPSPAESIKKDVIKRRAMSTYAQPIPNPFDDPDIQSLRPLRRASTQVLKKRDHGSVATTGTSGTVGSDPIAEVHALAKKFPNPPGNFVGTSGPNMTPIPEQRSQYGYDGVQDERTPGRNRSSSVTTGNSKRSNSTRSNSIRRKPVPSAPPGLMAQSVTSPAPLPAQPPPMPRTSMEDQRAAQIRQQLRKNWTPSDFPPSAGADLRSKNSAAAYSVSTAAHTNMTMGTSMAPSTPPTGISFRTAIDSVYDPGYVVPLPEDRPMGRLADRAIDMEAYLDREKEKRGLTPPSSVTTAPRTLEDRKIWEQEQGRSSPGLVAHRRPQGNANTEYPWAPKEDPVMGAKADLEAAWKTATTTARMHNGAEHAGGGDHSIGQVKSLNRVTTRRQPVVRPVVHSVLSMTVDEHEGSIGDHGPFVDPYASVVPVGMRAIPVPEEPDSPLDRWEPSPYIRP